MGFIKLKLAAAEGYTVVINLDQILYMWSNANNKVTIIIGSSATPVTVDHTLEEIRTLIKNRNKDATWKSDLG
jgi:hypothetical protein